MSSPKLSVVMSVFNGQEYLSEAVESILAQTFHDFEFLIVDDGSTDRTPQILSEFAALDKRVRIVSQSNRGRAISLNIGIDLSAGKYIARMDADDVALPTRFEEQLRFLEQHPDVIILGGAVELIDMAGQVLGTFQQPLEDEQIRLAMQSHCPICHPTVLMKKESALAAGGYRKALLDADDYDLWWRMAELGKLANLGGVILRYRVHAGQVSQRGMRQQVLCVLAARAAAMLRKTGGRDLLSEVEEVTPQVLKTLGVEHAEIQQGMLRSYVDWIEIVERCNPDAALQMTMEFLQQADIGCIGRTVLANEWLRAATICYKRGKLARAIFCVARAMLARPVIAGRPLKRAFMQLAAR